MGNTTSNLEQPPPIDTVVNSTDDAEKPTKRRKVAENHSDVGPSDLCRLAAGCFKNKRLRLALLSSPNISSVDILPIFLEYVFGWTNRATYLTRKKALNFVTSWLEQDAPGESSFLKQPSLTCLCAQKIAMEKFHSFVEIIDTHFADKNVAKMMDVLQKDLVETPVPDHIQERIKEELCIFVIVYLFFVDVRTWTIGFVQDLPLNLPIYSEEEKRSDRVYSVYCKRVADKIKNRGRGALAKGAILPHSILTHFSLSFWGQDKWIRSNVTAMAYALDSIFPHRNIRNPFCHPSVFNHHPFAYSAITTPIAALVYAYFLHEPLATLTDQFVTLNNVKNIMSWMDLYRKHKHLVMSPTLDEYSSLVLLTLKSMPLELENIEARPLKSTTNLNEIVSNCFYLLKTMEMAELLPAHTVKRLSLKGNFSKLELLKFAVICFNVESLDLQHCYNLDEECLEIILHHLVSVKTVVLKGTAINASSRVIKKAQLLRKGIEFDFGVGGDLGPSELFIWASEGCSNNDLKTELLSSPVITSPDVLRFTLEYVFGWKCWMAKQPKTRALDFVTKWLASDPRGESSSNLPTLVRLSAQRLAMETFHKLVDMFDRSFTEKDSDKFMSLFDCDLVSTAVPERICNIVKEELCIFVIVYLLYTDLRTLKHTPENAYRLKLPINREPTDGSDADNWWWWMFDEFKHAEIMPVRGKGRGLLAKISLLPHAILTSYTRIAAEREYNGSDEAMICSMELFVIQTFPQVGPWAKHPFACSSAMASVAPFINTFMFRFRYTGLIHNETNEPLQIILAVMIPWMEFYLSFYSSKKAPPLDEYGLLLLGSQRALPDNFLKWVSSVPLKAYPDIHVDVRNCIDWLEAITLVHSLSVGHMKKLRLNGNFSKVEMLRCAIMSRDAELVDFQHCRNLDEECLNSILCRLKCVKTVLLKGTPISKDSEGIRRILARWSTTHFVFRDED